jgi:hypothetical protein
MEQIDILCPHITAPSVEAESQDSFDLGNAERQMLIHVSLYSFI